MRTLRSVMMLIVIRETSVVCWVFFVGFPCWSARFVFKYKLTKQEKRVVEGNPPCFVLLC